MTRRATRLFFILAAIMTLLIPAVGVSKIGGGDITYTPKGAGKVMFQHEYHVNLKGQKCTNCHYRSFQMSKGSYKMDMQKLTKGEFCGLCHNGKSAFGLIQAENCKKCHKD